MKKIQEKIVKNWKISYIVLIIFINCLGWLYSGNLSILGVIGSVVGVSIIFFFTGQLMKSLSYNKK